MDTTPEYVKQCERAIEIQRSHDITDYEHDCVFCRDCQEVCHEDSGYYFCCGESDLLWLPRQDQLQKMVQHTNTIPAALLWDFARWEDNASFSRYGLKSWEDLSLEMLWLAYVMYKLHNKVWNGTDWVVE